MNKVIVRATRVFLLRAFGMARLERMVIRFARGVGMDLLTLGYRSVGCLNWADLSESGEKFLINELRRSGIWPGNPVLFDVGANIGDYSKALTEAFPAGQIYAFEPNPNTFEILKRNVNGDNVACIPAGLGSAAGAGTLNVYPDNLSSPHASRSVELLTDFHRCPNPTEIPFEITTVDSFCAKNAISRIGLLKIDAEGFELDVLKGAREMLARSSIDLIQFEFGEGDVYTRVFLRDFFEMLPGHKFFRLGTNELISLSRYGVAHEIFRFQNVLAVNNNLKFPR